MDLPFDSLNQQTMSPDPAATAAISVADLTRCVRGVIEAEDLFRDIWVRGEISNVTRHSSGHIYFSMKDETALIRCVMWKSDARSLRFDLSEGLSILAHGRVTVYERQGQYQLVADDIRPDGAGTLYAAFEELKQRLREEGLFDDSRKKPLPRFPQSIAIVTSPTGAALRDIVSIARRRMPCVNLLLVPALVQGADSEVSVAESLRIADALPDVEVIVVGRGGGSIEDLWTFNTEAVVRAIAACRMPVVSAVGHETDYTLSDFAADLRAPTPSAAMELVLCDRTDLTARLDSLAGAMGAALSTHISTHRANLDILVGHPGLRHPERLIQDRWQSLDLVQDRLQTAFRNGTSRHESRLAEVSAKLNSLSPLGVLSRGYGIVRRAEDGRVVRRVLDIEPSVLTETLLQDGRLISEVKEIKEGWD